MIKTDRSGGVRLCDVAAPTRNHARQVFAGVRRAVDALRVRGFPFADEVFDFIAAHDRIYLVEQNRDAQLKTLVVTEGGVDPGKLISLLHYDGTPITARYIASEIAERMASKGVISTQTEAAE